MSLDNRIRGRGPRFFDHRGRRLDRDGRISEDGDYEVDFFVYLLSFGSIASQATGNANQLVQADADFEWLKTGYYAELNGVAAPLLDSQVPQLDMQVTDGGSMRQLFSAAVPLAIMAGNGKLPFEMFQPRIFKASANIQVTLFNHSIAGKGPGAQTYDNVFVALIGRKVWTRAQARDRANA